MKTPMNILCPSITYSFPTDGCWMCWKYSMLEKTENLQLVSLFIFYYIAPASSHTPLLYLNTRTHSPLEHSHKYINQLTHERARLHSNIHNHTHGILNSCSPQTDRQTDIFKMNIILILRILCGAHSAILLFFLSLHVCLFVEWCQNIYAINERK